MLSLIQTYFLTRSKKLTKTEYVGSYDDVCIRFKRMLLSKALTCMQFFIYKQNGWFIKETDIFCYIDV